MNHVPLWIAGLAITGCALLIIAFAWTAPYIPPPPIATPTAPAVTPTALAATPLVVVVRSDAALLTNTAVLPALATRITGDELRVWASDQQTREAIQP